MRQLGKTVTEYETKLKELAEFVPEVANFEDYLCSKFEKGLNLEVWEKMYVSSNQSYKEIVQLALREEKLTNERLNRGKFQKMKSFGFLSRQSSKKSKSSKSSEHSSGSDVESVSSPQAFRAPQPSRLGTSPPSSIFRGGSMSERCPRCHQFHIGACSVPQGICFHCGQPGHLKKKSSKVTSTSFGGQSLRQLRTVVPSYGRAAGRSSAQLGPQQEVVLETKVHNDPKELKLEFLR